MSDQIHKDIADLKNDVASLKVDIARVEAETRVTKHDVSNLRDMFSGLGVRLDRLDEKFTAKLEASDQKLAGKIEALGEKLTGLNLKQERGVGFFAGVSAVMTIAGGVLLALAKALFA